MEPESSLPYSQAPTTCPYPEPTPSSPHNPFPLPEDLRNKNKVLFDSFGSRMRLLLNKNTSQKTFNLNPLSCCSSYYIIIMNNKLP